MDATAAEPTLDLQEPALRRTVEERLSAARGRPVRATSVSRRPSPFATLSPADVLTVELAGGETLSLFLKHCGGQQTDHPDKQCPNREARVYAELLQDERLPVVRHYGARSEAGDVRWALLLEYIDAWSLKYYDLPQWAGAVRRLADLHAHFAAQPARLSRCDALLRFDADYFRAWAQRALDAAARCAADLGRRLEPVVHESGIAAEFIVSMPPTLVHNDLSPKNVLLDRSQEPSTVAFVDWEMAGIGCGLLDLAHLTYGLDAAGVRWLCDAYRTAWSGPVPLPANDSEFGRPFASCQLHKTLYRLARWEAWRVPPARVAQWVSEAERLCARISSGEGVGA